MLSDTLKKIKSEFGNESIMTSKDYKDIKVDVIPTGLLSLDIALGRGGIPKGRITEIYGAESSGKSTLSLMIMAQAQKMGDNVALIDVEMAFDQDYAKKLGIDVDKLVISQPNSGEQALEIVERLVNSGDIGVIVIDSVAALVPMREVEGNYGDAQMGLQARMMSQAMRKLTNVISKTNTSVIFLNQTRMKLGIMFGSPITTSGGMALKFYTSIRVELKRGKQILKDGQHSGNIVHLKVVKNKIAPPFKTCEIEMLDDEIGFSINSDLFNLAQKYEIVRKEGNTWYLGKEKLGVGLKNAMENIDQDKLRGLIIEKYEKLRV